MPNTDELVIEQLEPCPNPWCGDHLNVVENRPPLWRVSCGCGVQGPTAYTQAEAVAAWNTRLRTAPDQVEAVALIELVAEGLWHRARKALGLRADYLPSSRSDFRDAARKELAAMSTRYDGLKNKSGETP